MTSWPDRRIIDLFRISVPIIQAPMAGASTPEMAIAVSAAGGLGSLPCALYTAAQAKEAFERIRAATSYPVNLNFFCHEMQRLEPEAERAWRQTLAPYYREYGLDPEASVPRTGRAPFDPEFLSVVETCRPEVVSFHFGLPDAALLDGVRATGAKIISSATTVAEARWLEARGCDAIIAMGAEAGGHRGMFLTEDVGRQVGLFALLPQIVDAVKVPVIAAGGIGDARGIVAAFALGAAAVQLGTAYLLSLEATITEFHRAALQTAADDATAITNVFTGRPARSIVNRLMREVGPMSPAAPPFPYAGGALQPLRTREEADFTNQWAGQASPFVRQAGAADITRQLAEEALRYLGSLGHD